MRIDTDHRRFLPHYRPVVYDSYNVPEGYSGDPGVGRNKRYYRRTSRRLLAKGLFVGDGSVCTFLSD